MYIFLCVIVYLLCMAIYFSISHFFSGILMIAYAVMQYILVYKKNKNYLDMKAVFVLTWYGTMGLSMLMLLGYQTIWSIKFFVVELVGVVILLLSIDLGHHIYRLFFYKRHKVYSDDFQISTYRVVILFTIIGFMCYLINLHTVGFIPLFSKSVSAYVDNTSKYMTIEIGLAPAAGAAYYCATRKGISRSRKRIMFLCMVLDLIVYPVLNLSRGNLVANICMFLPVYIYCSQDRKKAVKRIAIIGGFAFLGLTFARGGNFSSFYSSLGIRAGSLFDRFGARGNSLAMIYAYMTCSHDNFAYNIPTFNAYTNGLRMFDIFNEILDISWIQEVLSNSKPQLINSFLNTHDTFAFFYYDIGVLGVIIWTFLWGIIWGISEKFCLMRSSVDSYMMFGISFYCVAFAFYTSKTGFVVAMWYGTVWLCYLFQKIRISHI